MDNKQTSFRTKLTPVQLQQRLIYTQSELKKYKAQVEKYQNDYYYNMIDELKEKEQAWVLERDELQQNLVTANETIQLLQDELTTLKTQEKADHSSAPKGKKEIPMPTQNTLDPDTTRAKEDPKEIDPYQEETPISASKNQDWFLRSVKGSKKNSFSDTN
ncbi:hypothetical protein MKX54_13240 [Alkalihalobacillus sp. FSL R5-0424]